MVSPRLLAELTRVLAYPKLRARVDSNDAEVFFDWLSRQAVLVTAQPDARAGQRTPTTTICLPWPRTRTPSSSQATNTFWRSPTSSPILSPARFLETVESSSIVTTE